MSGSVERFQPAVEEGMPTIEELRGDGAARSAVVADLRTTHQHEQRKVAELTLALRDARADGEAERAREIEGTLRTTEEQVRRTGDALAEAERRLDAAKGALATAEARTAEQDERERRAVVLPLVPQARDEVTTVVRTQLMPIVERVQAALRAAIEAERANDHAHGRTPRAVPRILDDLGRVAPGALQALRGVELLANGEPFVIVAAQQASIRDGGQLQSPEVSRVVGEALRRLRG
jgi:hypothetical protein